jgi:hypothetical protein
VSAPASDLPQRADGTLGAERLMKATFEPISEIGDEEPGPSPTLEAAFNDGRLRIVTARAFAALHELGAEPVLGTRETNILAADGLVVFWGKEGGGKTSVTLDLSCHLAAGTPWLSIDIPQKRRVLIVENEGPRGPFRSKIRAKLEHWRDDVDGNLLVQEEPWAQFSFSDDAAREGLALAYFRGDPVVGVNVSVATESIEGSVASVRVVTLLTRGRATGCKSWSGGYRLVRVGAKWLIDYATLRSVRC